MTYSGSVAGGIGSSDVVNWLKANSPDARLIGNTELAKFLNGDIFKQHVSTVFGSNPDIRGTPAYDFVGGDPQSSLWATSSKNFVDGAEGSVRSITPFADPSRVWAQTEFETFLNDPKATDLWGVSREAFIGFRDLLTRVGIEPGDALTAARDLATFISREKLGGIDIARDASGNITWVDAAKLLGDPAAAKPIPADATIGSLGDLMGALSKSQLGELSSLSSAMDAVSNNQTFWRGIGATEAGLGVLGAFALGFTAAEAAIRAKEAYDMDDPITAQTIVRDWSLGTVGAMAAGGLAFEGAAMLLVPLALLGPIGIGAGIIGALGTSLLAAYWGHQAGIGFGEAISSAVNSLFSGALNWVPPRRDPLVLDLNGNGITTSGINPNAPILFDQDGDGTKTATGWIASGEAIVVRDLDGNGTIDSGRDLFGDNTILTHGARAGQKAANGFEALADLDANANGVADGKFDSHDVAFSSVKLWKDLNQDGVSQANELLSFADLGVASINVAGTASNVNLGGGNTQTFSGSFTKADGTVGSSGTAHMAGSLLLANNNFYREFTDDPAVSTEAAALPQMTGSGAVRDLRPSWAPHRHWRCRPNWRSSPPAPPKRSNKPAWMP
ncbi:hypothetical protein [Variovorax rhizosphaerae]|uniref:Uncharacterized protein n=1 Tax=Variovorax rhizosphaerae TaxID=1836200 RepID=A0ABU8WS56_9BURK